MRPSAVVCSSLAISVASASRPGMALIPGPSSSGFSLLARQNPFCTSESTCAECFGDGYIICDDIGCFNPEEHDQCCAGAAVCVGKDNSCCEDFGGPGVTGKAGVPTGTTPATPTPTGDTDTGSYNCYRDDTGEECCQRAPNPPLHWCSGDFPQFVCYNPKNQFCCANGKVCSDEDCCEDLFNVSTTHPWSSARSTATLSTSSSSSATGTITQAPTATDSTDSSSTPSPSTDGGSVSRPSYIALGLVALGLALS